MSTYYWSKYYAVEKYNWSDEIQGSGGTRLNVHDGTTKNYCSTKKPLYSESNGYYLDEASKVSLTLREIYNLIKSGTTVYISSLGYISNTDELRYYTAFDGVETVNGTDRLKGTRYSRTKDVFTGYTRGSLITSTLTGSYSAYTNNARNSDGYWYVRGGLVNAVPTVSLTTPTPNQTLYENDIFNIDGTANDTNSGDVVTIRYQINAETVRAIDSFISNGSAKAFGKQLRFSAGNLYDGETLIAANLTDGVEHTLKVWAVDDASGTSTIISRTFYVVPNRAPVLNVNPPTTDGSTDGDKITINGDFNDPDGNTSVVKYRINGGNSVQIAEGVSGEFEFELSFSQLQLGVNNIVIEVIDSHNSKVSRTVKLNKTSIETPILKSTARYKIQPPTGSASAVLFWITRDENLQLDASISMTMQGETESFTPVVASNSALSPDFVNAIEDEFYFEADSPKDTIILQLDLTRTSIEVSPKVYIIQGVLE